MHLGLDHEEAFSKFCCDERTIDLMWFFLALWEAANRDPREN
jgi:hypothetical protein